MAYIHFCVERAFINWESLVIVRFVGVEAPYSHPQPPSFSRCAVSRATTKRCSVSLHTHFLIISYNIYLCATWWTNWLILLLLFFFFRQGAMRWCVYGIQMETICASEMEWSLPIFVINRWFHLISSCRFYTLNVATDMNFFLRSAFHFKYSFLVSL